MRGDPHPHRQHPFPEGPWLPAPTLPGFWPTGMSLTRGPPYLFCNLPCQVSLTQAHPIPKPPNFIRWIPIAPTHCVA